MSYKAILNVNLLAARVGANELEFCFKKINSYKSFEQKSRFVENVAKAVEEILIEEIKKYYPYDNFSTTYHGDEINNSEVTWYIDPLNGKQNFFKGIPHFSISVATVEEGSITTGVIIDPVRREEFCSTKGSGAELNRIKARTSNQQNPANGTFAVNASSKNIEKYQHKLLSIVDENITLRNSGSSALDLAYVATGRYDASILEGFKFKKVAAGIIISQESGALIGDLKGNPNIFDANSIVSATAKCFKPLIKTFNN